MKMTIPTVLAALLLTACSQGAIDISAKEPDAGASCSLDGMVLKDFPGSKAQVRYADGKTDYYCDVMELFSIVFAPEQKRVVGALYVQDMGKANWDQPSGNWIDARKAIYVIGSKKHGSMGPTIVPFANANEAQAFAAREGGSVLNFSDVKPDMVKMGGGAAHDAGMGGGH